MFSYHLPRLIARSSTKRFAAAVPSNPVHPQGDLGVAIAGVEAARRHGIPLIRTKRTRYDGYFEQVTQPRCCWRYWSAGCKNAISHRNST